MRRISATIAPMRRRAPHVTLLGAVLVSSACLEPPAIEPAARPSGYRSPGGSPSDTARVTPIIQTTTAWEPVRPIAFLPKRYKRVLHAGDSLTGAMGLALGKKFLAEGSGYHKDVWVGVSVATFDTERRFTDQLRAHDPDLVLLTLGANDVDSPAPEKIADHVRSIVRKVGERDCYWIGPATWKEDTGVVDVIADNCSPCRFFDSRGIKLERKDGIHPTIKGGEVWADRFWEYFGHERLEAGLDPQIEPRSVP